MVKVVYFQVRLTLDDVMRLESEPLPFATTHFAAPPFEGALTKDEKVTFIKTVPKITDRDSTLTTLLQRLIIVIILGGTLAFFWFGLPRFVWPERYLQSALSNYPGIPTMP